jgi:hypothetical protein
MTRTRTLLVGLGLSLALTLAAASPAAAVSTLTGESLSGSSSSGNTSWCPTPTFSISGTATGPFPGTFSEAGSWDMRSGPFTATFTITSGTTTVTGSKTADTVSPPTFGGMSCGVHRGAFANFTYAPYTATIRTPNGNFHDEGLTNVHVIISAFPAGGMPLNLSATQTESFTSSLTAPVLIAPTSKDQCKNNGWKAFPQFKNQGQCVSFVEREGQT